MSSLEKRIQQLRDERNELDEEILELEDELQAIRLADYPKEPGWYLDAEGRIAQLTEFNRWDDGWGNPWDGNEGVKLPKLPMTRLVGE